MSMRNTVRAFPTMLRVGFSEALAYRAELLVWVLSTTMPFIMMALWTAVAREAPVGPLNQKDFVGYFLGTFVVRQLTGAWAAWQINYEVRQGTLAMRLLRPISPLWAYAAENLGAVPMRIMVAVPVAVFSVLVVGQNAVPPHWWGWPLLLVALLGGWLITFLANVCIGTMSLFMESSQHVMDVWLVLFFILSGYMFPVAVLPEWVKGGVNWLPFRYQIGLPVEVMTGAHPLEETLGLIARQWIWVLLLGTLAVTLWRRGLRRFAAYGG